MPEEVAEVVSGPIRGRDIRSDASGDTGDSDEVKRRGGDKGARQGGSGLDN